jgi:hypothetical protein
MRMSLGYRNNGTVTYAIQYGYRLLYAIFCLLMIAGFIVTLADEEFSGSLLIPALLFLLGLIGVGYRECWIFDPDSKEVRSILGWAFLVKREIISFSSIEKLEISHFIRGYMETTSQGKAVRPRGRNKAMVVFSLLLKDSSRRDIEIIPERVSGGKTENAAQAIAIKVGLNYSADRGPDHIQQMSIRDL